MKRQYPTQQEIAERAYFIYLERGGSDGHHFRDWFEAEKALTTRYPVVNVKKPAPKQRAAKATPPKHEGAMASHARARQS
jgi:hypothetical protein